MGGVLACHIEKTEKCTKLYALIVVKNAKFRLNQIPAGLFTVGIVGQKEDDLKDLDIRLHRILSEETLYTCIIHKKYKNCSTFK